MAIDTVPMLEMFDACHDVLNQELCPMHYTELTKKALGRLGLTERDVNWQRQIEDVREKMLLVGKYDTFYTGKPLCLAGIKWWFETAQQRLFHPTSGIVIPGSAKSGADGAYEALMRDPYMKVKNVVRRETVARTRANGIVLEKHVADWFKQKYHNFYLPPENNKQWEKPCDHDFRLKIQNRIYKFDVSGPKLNGQFGNPGQGKKTTDFHLICEITGKDVLWRSVFPGGVYAGLISPELGICPERMLVWLNCEYTGINYRMIKNSLALALTSAYIAA